MTTKTRAQGSKKITNEVRQYCIDASTFDDFLGSIPETVDIVSMTLRIGTPFLRKKYRVEKQLERLGVTYVTVPAKEAKEINVRFEGMNRKEMSKNLDKICSAESVSRTLAKVRRACVSFEGIIGYFEKTSKEIRPDATDQRRKLYVLGLTGTEKSGSASLARLIRALSLSRYSCQMEDVTVKRIMCSKIR